jgi:hypothetical protein
MLSLTNGILMQFKQLKKKGCKKKKKTTLAIKMNNRLDVFVAFDLNHT